MFSSMNDCIDFALSCFRIKSPLELYFFFFNTTPFPMLSLYVGLFLNVIWILPSTFCRSSSLIFNRYSSLARSVIFIGVQYPLLCLLYSMAVPGSFGKGPSNWFFIFCTAFFIDCELVLLPV